LPVHGDGGWKSVIHPTVLGFIKPAALGFIKSHRYTGLAVYRFVLGAAVLLFLPSGA
jgi:undecaprenyl pyrophosphate phosphatase UppP